MRRVIIAAGHNGAGTGAKGYIDEGTETIKLRDCLVDWLKIKEPTLEVITDRGKDKLTLSGGLLKWLKSIFKKEDICLDLHFNAFNGVANGTEVVIPDKYSQFEWLYGRMLRDSVVTALQTATRPNKTETQSQHSKLAMLSGFDCENFLLEVCLCDNYRDAENYANYKPELIAAIGGWLRKTAKL
jgi:N-acetylmuramoyl-L-alanine amidase